MGTLPPGSEEPAIDDAETVQVVAAFLQIGL